MTCPLEGTIQPGQDERDTLFDILHALSSKLFRKGKEAGFSEGRSYRYSECEENTGSAHD